MKVMKNFTARVQVIDDVSVLMFTDENGNDWYHSQKEFATDTIKFTFDDTGLVTSWSGDASMLAPENLSVAELDKAAFPDAFFLSSGQWVFDGETVMQRKATPAELTAQAEKTKTDLLETAAEKIAPLQDAVELDMATDAEQETLLAWKKYRVLLNRVDASKAPDIEWPEIPGNVA